MFCKNSEGKNFIHDIKKRRLDTTADFQYQQQRSTRPNVIESEVPCSSTNQKSIDNASTKQQSRFERLYPTRIKSTDESEEELFPSSSSTKALKNLNTVTNYFQTTLTQSYQREPVIDLRTSRNKQNADHEVDQTSFNGNTLTNKNTVSKFLTSIPSNHQRELPVQEVKPTKPEIGFRTAREELMINNVKKNGNTGMPSTRSNDINSNSSNTSTGRRLGLSRSRSVFSNFVCPVQDDERIVKKQSEEIPLEDERLANIDPKMIEMIRNEIMKKPESIDWSDIAGLSYAKSVIEEIVIAALLRPDLYKGLRRPPRGVLLFGPPGTGKTLIGRCIASQSESTFFSISASSITSKYVGESEKMVRALFAVAAVHQPAVIFIDEIDSMLCKRSEGEQEFTRRLKNEFFVQLDGTTTTDDDRIVVVGATNRPQELDEAARRRLVRRLYIPLPDLSARLQMITNLLKSEKHNLDSAAINEIGELTDGYSCADLKCLLKEASMKPVRGIPFKELMTYKVEDIRPINKADIISSLRTVRPTVAQSDLQPYIEWNRLYGSICED